MLGFFSRSPAKQKSVEERLEELVGTLHTAVNAAIEQSFAAGDSGTLDVCRTAASDAFTGILTILIDEDCTQSASEGFGPGLLHILSLSFFDQLTAWAQLDQPPGMFSKVLYFFTMLVIDVRNQQVLQHVAFNRALLSALVITDERLKRGQVFAEAKDATVPLIHAICCRVLQDSTLSSCFLAEDPYSPPQYIVVPLLEYFLRTEKKEDVSALECVEMLGRTEDEPVLHYLSTSSLLPTVAHRLTRYLLNLPRTTTKFSTQSIKCKELDEACKYVRFLDTFCCSCLHSGLVRVLVAALRTDCFQPYLAPNLSSSDLATRGLFTLYLLQIVRECRSWDLLQCIALTLRGSEDTHRTHSRFESDSTMASARGQDAIRAQPSVWQAFVDNLQSMNVLLRMSSLRVLYALVAGAQWKVATVLLADMLQWRTAPGSVTCGFERFLSLLPGSLLYNDMRAAAGYYYESLNQTLSLTLPGDSLATREEVHRPQSRYEELETKPESTLVAGQLLKTLLNKLESLLMNSVEENLLVTGILTMLSRTPATNASTAVLFSVLFDGSEPTSMLSVLRKVESMQIDERIVKVSHDTSNFESALYGARKALGLEVDPSLHADKIFTELILKRPSGTRSGNSKKIRDTHFIEVTASQGVVVYQEFVRELAGCVLMQEEINRMRESFDTEVV